jgi:hypothetical protein
MAAYGSLAACLVQLNPHSIRLRHICGVQAVSRPTLSLNRVADVFLGDLAALGAGRGNGIEDDVLLDRGDLLVRGG